MQTEQSSHAHRLTDAGFSAEQAEALAEATMGVVRSNRWELAASVREIEHLVTKVDLDAAMRVIKTQLIVALCVGGAMFWVTLKMFRPRLW